jgi:hypothetical protein
MSHRYLIALVTAAAVGVSPQSAAGIIVDSPSHLATVFTMTDFPADPRNDNTAVTSVASPLGGSIEFWTEGHGVPLAMTLDKDSGWFPVALGEVYKTTVGWVELILPANTRAFSFNVGASSNGSGWVEAFDDAGASAFRAFTVGANNTPGFGFAATGSCGSISKVIVEPWEWGVGNFAISQGSCAQVPEPGTLGLLVTGVLGLVALRRRRPS